MQIAMGVAEDADVKKAYSESPDQYRHFTDKNPMISRTQSGAYIIFMDTSGSALIDPYPFMVRTELVGEDRERVLQGESYTSRSAAYSAPAIRAFVPIYNYNNDVQLGQWSLLSLNRILS